MNINELKKERESFLITVYSLSKGTNQPIDTMQICEILNIDYGTEASEIGQHLYAKGLLSWAGFAAVYLSDAGIEAAEKIMEQKYADEELMILREIHERGKNHPNGLVKFEDLATDFPNLSLPMHEIIEEIDRKGLLGQGVDEYIKIGSGGLELLQKKSNRTGGITINDNRQHNTIHSGANSINTIGNYNQITNSQTVNPEFDNAVRSLIDLINASSMENEEREDAFDILKSVNKIALREPTPTLLERGLTFVTALKPIFETINLLGAAAPHLAVLLSHFEYVK